MLCAGTYVCICIRARIQRVCACSRTADRNKIITTGILFWNPFSPFWFSVESETHRWSFSPNYFHLSTFSHFSLDVTKPCLVWIVCFSVLPNDFHRTFNRMIAHLLLFFCPLLRPPIPFYSLYPSFSIYRLIQNPCYSNFIIWMFKTSVKCMLWKFLYSKK